MINLNVIEFLKHMLESEYEKMLVWLVFILILMFADNLTGFIGAFLNKTLVSGKMAQGLLKKFALLCVLVLIIPFTLLLPNVVSTNVIITVYTLETINEFVSILENLSKMGININIFNVIIDKLKISNTDKEGEKNE